MSEPVAIYCRISKDVEDDQLGVRRQERLCRAVCEARGWDVAEVFVDNDISASGRKPRPAFDRLLAAVEEGRFRALVTLDLDRLTRSHRDLLRIVEACTTHNVRVEFEREAGFDPVTGNGMLEIEIRTSVAAQELRKIRQRTQRKKRELAEQGRPNGGPRPLGYTSSGRTEIVEGEAETIRAAVARVLAGASQGDTCRWLNDRGMTTANGTSWTVSRLRRLLLRADIAGLREHNGGAIPAVWEPIITVEEHQRLAAILSNVRRHRAPSQYLLTPPDALVYCECGQPLYGAGGRDRRIYRCKWVSDLGGASRKGCGRTQIRADWLEDHVVDFALEWSTTTDVIARRRDERDRVRGEQSELRRKLTDLDLRESRLVDDLVDLGLSRTKIRAKAGELRRERAELERRLARIESAEDRLLEGGPAEEVRGRWADLTHNERRLALRSLLKRVTVRAGVPGRNTFDPRRIEIVPDWTPLVEGAETYAKEHDLPLWEVD